ncbi:MAG TPA: DMT family transporter [Anaerovoracaceae bacterium]|nr:DMT family transporter [Anaerovoracaceae bacterium]
MVNQLYEKALIFQGLSKYKIGILSAACAACLFGLSVIFTRKGVSEESALTLISWRFLIAFLVMTILIRFRVVKADLRDKPIWGVLRIAAFTSGIYFLAEGKGLQLTTASEGATILASA